MSKRGEIARLNVMNTVTDAFKATNHYISTIDKKIYVTAEDGLRGETIQFAITFTMPKTPISALDGGNALDSSSSSPVGLTQKDKQQVQELMRQLGIPDD